MQEGGPLGVHVCTHACSPSSVGWGKCGNHHCGSRHKVGGVHHQGALWYSRCVVRCGTAGVWCAVVRQVCGALWYGRCVVR